MLCLERLVVSAELFKCQTQLQKMKTERLSVRVDLFKIHRRKVCTANELFSSLLKSVCQKCKGCVHI